MSLPDRPERLHVADRSEVKATVLANAGGCSSGGARTYVIALVDELERGGDRGLNWEFLVHPDLASSIAPSGAGNVRIRAQTTRSPLKRILWEQLVLPWRARRRGASSPVLLSVANFGPLSRRSRHVLIAHNALYFSDFRVGGPRGVRLTCEGWLARASVKLASVTVVPTEAMAALVTGRTQREVVPISFGPGQVRGRATSRNDRFTFVHRTSWGPHKRLGDVLLAVRELGRSAAGRFVVRSACDLESDFARSFRESERERALLADPVIASHVEFSPLAPNGHVEIDGDAVVVPSTIESFCFPIAEAIGANVPVIAADSSFARELCGDAAIYVEPENPAALAAGMARVLRGELPPPPSPDVRRRLSWERHVDLLAEICRRTT
jgi:glycosyltransferase involved in cell wall biosynthesis